MQHNQGNRGAPPPPYSAMPPTGTSRSPRPNTNPRYQRHQHSQRPQGPPQGHRSVDVRPHVSIHNNIRIRESEPLLPHRSAQHERHLRGNAQSTIRCWLWLLVLVLVASVVAGPVITAKASRSENCLLGREMERIREQWAIEKRQHQDMVERSRAEWDRERLEHDAEAAEREEVKRRWQWEDAAHAAKLERWRREEEERQRIEFFWKDFAPSRCVRHGTREYTAKLANVPRDFAHSIEVCRDTEMSVNGEMKRPTRCQDRGGENVEGIWEEAGEAICGTYFNWFKDKGCTANSSGLRRYEMFLENLKPEDDWQAMCSSTPASFLGKEFAHPHHCVRWGTGTYGLWDIKDGSCL